MSHDSLRNRVEKLECYLYDNRNYYGDIIQLAEGNQLGGNNTSLKDKSSNIRNSRSVANMTSGGNNFVNNFPKNASNQ